MTIKPQLQPLYAWAWKNNPTRINAWRYQVDQDLGLIHYPNTYSTARRGDIAFVNNVHNAKSVVAHQDVFAHAILGDERNVPGPSGPYETPQEYNERLNAAYDVLLMAGVPTSHKGLAMKGGRFDASYAKEIRIGDHRGVNTHPIHYNRMLAGVRSMPNEKFFVTEIPWRWRWDFTIGFLWQQWFTYPRLRGQLERLMADSRVLGVGVWCLREGQMSSGEWQDYHGLIDRSDRLTWQGRMVKEILESRRR